MVEKSAWSEIADKDKSVWKKIDDKDKKIKLTEKESFKNDLNRLRKKMRTGVKYKK